jgi:hypothetical protein
MEATMLNRRSAVGPLILTTSLLVGSVQSRTAITPQTSAYGCRVTGDLVRLEGLSEASGVAASRRVPNVFWAHNDSGDPLLFALDAQGATLGRVRVTGAKLDDWEDIAVGPCPQGSCVYIADIGDNGGTRDRITIYRTRETDLKEDATQPTEVFHGRYPDGKHDAEALFVMPDSDVYLITKGDPGPIALYRFPRPLQTGSVMQLERVGPPARDSKTIESADRPTAADASRDGRWVAVRTTRYVMFHRAADLIAGIWKEVFRTDLSSLREPRGEGIALTPEGVAVLVGEGGGLSRTGTFARLACTLGS